MNIIKITYALTILVFGFYLSDFSEIDFTWSVLTIFGVMLFFDFLIIKNEKEKIELLLPSVFFGLRPLINMIISLLLFIVIAILAKAVMGEKFYAIILLLVSYVSLKSYIVNKWSKNK